MKIRKFNPFTALAVLAVTTTAASAAPGSLDSSFAASGKAIASYGATEAGNAVAVMPNGKIVVAGTTNVLGSTDFAVLRYNANGTLDTTFDGDGGVISDLGAASVDVATCVAVQPDGKILVGGHTTAESATSDFVVVRYNVDGSLDNFFGGDGKVVYNHSGDPEEGRAIKVQSDGKIVLAGISHIGNKPDFAIIRFLSDGTLDSTFDGGGYAEFIIGINDEEEAANAIAIQPDGKYVLAGYVFNGLSNDFAVIRLNSNGSVDNSFNGNGRRSVNFGNDDRANAVVIQPDGKILLGGSWTGGASDFALVRLNPNGTFDNTFSGDGMANAAFSPTGFGAAEFANAMALQPDGRIILAGYTNQFDVGDDFGLMRFTAAGLLDPSFDGDGKLTTTFTPGEVDIAKAIAIQPDGRVVVAGTTDGDFAVVRYNTRTRTDARIGSKSSATSGNDVYNNSGAGQSLDVVLKKGGKKNSFVRIQNDGHDTQSFTIRGTKGNSNFSIRYLNGSANVTAAVVAGTFSTGNLAPGATFLLKAEVVAKTTQPKKKLGIKVTGKSTNDPSNTDTVLIKAATK